MKCVQGQNRSNLVSAQNLCNDSHPGRIANSALEWHVPDLEGFEAPDRLSLNFLQWIQHSHRFLLQFSLVPLEIPRSPQVLGKLHCDYGHFHIQAVSKSFPPSLWQHRAGRIPHHGCGQHPHQESALCLREHNRPQTVFRCRQAPYARTPRQIRIVQIDFQALKGLSSLAGAPGHQMQLASCLLLQQTSNSFGDQLAAGMQLHRVQISSPQSRAYQQGDHLQAKAEEYGQVEPHLNHAPQKGMALASQPHCPQSTFPDTIAGVHLPPQKAPA
mmetsp:Transcript_7348/g.17658  ORF Transcript_7348/g.17658 Transcript_7348/m.17658 type:complete len:272 (-) Transcript_7348:1600-2415(-)